MGVCRRIQSGNGAQIPCRKLLPDRLAVEFSEAPHLSSEYTHSIPMRIPAGEGNAGGTGLITPWDSRERDRFLQAAKMKEEIIWEGARLLLFPDMSRMT